MAQTSRAQILQLYKALLREGSKFSPYSYREYTKRRVRDAFRENKNEQDEQRLKELVSKAEENLAILRRVTAVSQIYVSDPLIIERGASALAAGAVGRAAKQ